MTSVARALVVITTAPCGLRGSVPMETGSHANGAARRDDFTTRTAAGPQSKSL